MSRRLALPDDRERAAAKICDEYGMQQRDRPVRIYDAFMFNSELDMLEVRRAPRSPCACQHAPQELKGLLPIVTHSAAR